MKKGLPMATTIGLGLLIGSAGGAAAQETQRAAPVEVTGTSTEVSCPGAKTTYEWPVEFSRGWTCFSDWSTSDTRLDGEFTRAWNLDFHHDGTGLIFGYATGRLESTGGIWQQRPGLRAGFDGGLDLYEDVEMLVFDGQDDYEGLVAVVYYINREDGVELDDVKLHAYIVDAEYPPSDFLVE